MDFHKVILLVYHVSCFADIFVTSNLWYNDVTSWEKPFFFVIILMRIIHSKDTYLYGIIKHSDSHHMTKSDLLR